MGAAVLGADHVVKDKDRRDRSPLGSIHKGNGLNGSLLLLENVDPFGRGQRGASHVYVTKDRPGHLRRHGRPSKLPGKTYVGSLIVDDTRTTVPWTEVVLTEPPTEPTSTDPVMSRDDFDDRSVCRAVVTALDKYAAEDKDKPEDKRRREVTLRTVRGLVNGIGNDRIDNALERLVFNGQLLERRGPRGSRLFKPPVSEPTA